MKLMDDITSLRGQVQQLEKIISNRFEDLVKQIKPYTLDIKNGVDGRVYWFSSQHNYVQLNINIGGNGSADLDIFNKEELARFRSLANELGVAKVYFCDEFEDWVGEV